MIHLLGVVLPKLFLPSISPQEPRLVCGLKRKWPRVTGGHWKVWKDVDPEQKESKAASAKHKTGNHSTDLHLPGTRITVFNINQIH